MIPEPKGFVPAGGLAALALCMALVACGRSEEGTASGPEDAAPSPREERELVVFAASSLREAFTVMAADFEREHRGVTVTFNFAGTQELRTQVEHGARADVFASADRKHMDQLVHKELAASPVIFARNEPVLVVSRESGARIRSLRDLAHAERIVLGTPDVPIGRYTLQILERAGTSLGGDFRARVEARVVSRELNVKQVLAKVSLGEAEAGIVYRSDVQAARGVSTVTIPPELNVIAEYPVAVLSAAPHPTLARAFVELVLSERGQARLHERGFLPARERAKAP